MMHRHPRLLHARARAQAGAHALVCLSLGIGVVLSGCASGSPDYDRRFGDATRAITAQQLIDPAAPRHNAGKTPPTDGRTVREGMARQLESFKAPPPSQFITLGVGTGSTGSTGGTGQ
jgi:hypothetical protein